MRWAGVVMLAGCGDCEQPYTLEIGIWNLPDDVMTATMTVDDGGGERRCRVVFEPLDERDPGSGPTEPDIVEEDCPDATLVFSYTREWGVVYAPRQPVGALRVGVDFRTATGETGGFEPREVDVDWSRSYFDDGCAAAGRGWVHLTQRGDPFSSP